MKSDEEEKVATKKILVLLNPSANMGKALFYSNAISEWSRRLQQERGIAFEIRHTEQTGLRSTFNLAKWAAQNGYERLIAVGGDGTMQEVARGMLINGSGMALAAIMAGTGNDWGKGLGIPETMADALEVALSGHPVLVDVGQVELGAKTNDRRIFINVAGFGLDARIARTAATFKQELSFLPHKLLYLRAVFSELILRMDYPRLKIVAADSGACWEGEFTMVTVGIGPSCGAIFKLTPAASFYDGLFDMCLVQRASRLKIVRLLPLAISGGHVNRPEVSKDKEGKLPRSSSLQVSSIDCRPVPCHLDGEVLPPSINYQIATLPKALRVVLPNNPRI
jgi:YegS/Rv2252/BmrU family lipid kinase